MPAFKCARGNHDRNLSIDPLNAVLIGGSTQKWMIFKDSTLNFTALILSVMGGISETLYADKESLHQSVCSLTRNQTPHYPIVGQNAPLVK